MPEYDDEDEEKRETNDGPAEELAEADPVAELGGEPDPMIRTMAAAGAPGPAGPAGPAAPGMDRRAQFMQAHPMIARLVELAQQRRAMHQQRREQFMQSPMGQAIGQRFGGMMPGMGGGGGPMTAAAQGFARAQQPMAAPAGGEPAGPTTAARNAPGNARGFRDGPAPAAPRALPQRAAAPAQERRGVMPTFGGNANAGLQEEIRRRRSEGRMV